MASLSVVVSAPPSNVVDTEAVDALSRWLISGTSATADHRSDFVGEIPLNRVGLHGPPTISGGLLVKKKQTNKNKTHRVKPWTWIPRLTTRQHSKLYISIDYSFMRMMN